MSEWSSRCRRPARGRRNQNNLDTYSEQNDTLYALQLITVVNVHVMDFRIPVLSLLEELVDAVEGVFVH